MRAGPRPSQRRRWRRGTGAQPHCRRAGAQCPRARVAWTHAIRAGARSAAGSGRRQRHERACDRPSFEGSNHRVGDCWKVTELDNLAIGRLVAALIETERQRVVAAALASSGRPLWGSAGALLHLPTAVGRGWRASPARRSPPPTRTSGISTQIAVACQLTLPSHCQARSL